MTFREAEQHYPSKKAGFLMAYQKEHLPRAAQEKLAAEIQVSDVELHSVVSASERQVGMLKDWATTRHNAASAELSTHRDESTRYRSAAA